MRRLGIFILNVVFLLAFAVTLEVRSPGDPAVKAAITYGLAFLPMLAVSLVVSAFMTGRSQKAAPFGLGGMAAAIIAIAGHPGLGLAAGIQMFVSLLIAARRKAEPAPPPPSVENEVYPLAPTMYVRRPDGSFSPVSPSALRSSPER